MEKEFELQTEVGQTVCEIRINMPTREPRFSSEKEGIFIKELEIVYQTERKIALSDEWITCLDRQEKDKKQESYNLYLENIAVSIKTKETAIFTNGIFAHCYTLEDPHRLIDKIQKTIIKTVEKEYGFLSNIDIAGTIKNMQKFVNYE